LFAPFVEYEELIALFHGKNLLQEPELQDFYKALLGMEGVKPFECVGTVEELRQAYHMSRSKDDRYHLAARVSVPPSMGHYRETASHQALVNEIIDLGAI
jgi:hypothetical protein